MPGLSDSQLSVISTLIDTAPDSAIRSLDLALSAETRSDGPMAAIRDLVSLEAGERRARSMVFAPFVAMCMDGEPSYPRKTFPGATLSRLWKALKVSRRVEVRQAIAASMTWIGEGESPGVFDSLILAAAAGLREPAGSPFASAASLLDDAEPGGAALFASYLDLGPLARVAMTKLPDWLGRMTDERAAAARLALRDATDIAKDAGPRFIELLASRLDEPWQILRIISAFMDRPQDAFLAASEMAHIGERILGQIDAAFDGLNRFDPRGGADAGASAAEAVRMISIQTAEFEATLDLKRDGPWGARIAQLKKLTAQKAEAIIGKADSAVADALPLKPGRLGKKVRGVPRFDATAKPDSLAIAQSMMAFVEKSRSAAAAGGYASTRSKMIETLDDRLDHYVEDVLEHLRKDQPDMEESARRYLGVAAGLIGLLRDEKAAQIVRRRAAA